jgi:hypothetical protein
VFIRKHLEPPDHYLEEIISGDSRLLVSLIFKALMETKMYYVNLFFVIIVEKVNMYTLCICEFSVNTPKWIFESTL